MQRVSLRDIHTAISDDASKNVTDLRVMALSKFERDFEAFSHRLNSPAHNVPQLSAVRYNNPGTAPLFPVTFMSFARPGVFGFMLAAARSKIEAAIEKDGFSLTLHVTKLPWSSIFSPFGEKLVFDRHVSPFADDLIAAENARKSADWNFQRAVIAMVMCESDAAERGMYDELPRYKTAQNVMRCMPDALKPPAGSGRIETLDVDGDILRGPLQKIGDMREAAARAPISPVLGRA